MTDYLTLGEAASAQFIERKSRFIGHAAPVADEKAALAFLEDKRRAFRDASHNCYAYILGQNMGVMRYSDDGEPGGTAGMPILEGMRARGVTDACVVVTRYFGGILLGAGGLTRAYARACAEALSAARVVRMEATARYLMEMEYGLYDKVCHYLKSQPVIVEDAAFAAAVTVTLRVRARDEQALLSGLDTETNAKVFALREDEFSCAWEQAPCPESSK